MKPGKVCCVTTMLLTLAACTPPAEQVMPPLQYTHPVNVHVKKNAELTWVTGKQYTSMEPIYVSTGGGLVGAVVSAAIDTEMRKRNPGAYTYSYGAAQQAVFMTSLRDALERHQVFNRIELTAEPDRKSKDKVLLTVHFNTTRVNDASSHYKIQLDATLSIQSGKQVFERSYIVESDPGGFFIANSFRNQQSDVSQKLLGKMMESIEEWNSQKGRRVEVD